MRTKGLGQLRPPLARSGALLGVFEQDALGITGESLERVYREKNGVCNVRVDLPRLEALAQAVQDARLVEAGERDEVRDVVRVFRVRELEVVQLDSCGPVGLPTSKKCLSIAGDAVCKNNDKILR